MTNPLTIHDVFQEYGMTLYNPAQPDVPYTEIGAHLDFSEVASAIFNPNEVFTKEYPQDAYLKDLVAYLVTVDVYCRITNLERWLEKFGIDRQQLPFPETYLTQFDFSFFDPDGSPSVLAVPYTDVYEMASAVKKSVGGLFEELFPNSLLSPNEMRKQVQGRIELLDELPDMKKTLVFKEKLLQAVLYSMKGKLLDLM